jgi:hypothetical protein
MWSIAGQVRCPARRRFSKPTQAGRRVDADRPSAEARPITWHDVLPTQTQVNNDRKPQVFSFSSGLSESPCRTPPTPPSTPGGRPVVLTLLRAYSAAGGWNGEWGGPGGPVRPLCAALRPPRATPDAAALGRRWAGLVIDTPRAPRPARLNAGPTCPGRPRPEEGGSGRGVARPRGRAGLALGQPWPPASKPARTRPSLPWGCGSRLLPGPARPALQRGLPRRAEAGRPGRGSRCMLRSSAPCFVRVGQLTANGPCFVRVGQLTAN